MNLSQTITRIALAAAAGMALAGFVAAHAQEDPYPLPSYDTIAYCKDDVVFGGPAGCVQFQMMERDATAEIWPKLGQLGRGECYKLAPIQNYIALHSCAASYLKQQQSEAAVACLKTSTGHADNFRDCEDAYTAAHRQ